MAENKVIRLSKAAREFNVGISTIVEFLLTSSFLVAVLPFKSLANAVTPTNCSLHSPNFLKNFEF